MPGRRSPGDGVGIQVPAGRIAADRIHWQTVLESRDKVCLYRLCNASRRTAGDPGNAMVVEVDGSKRPLKVGVGASVDVMARRIRVRAGIGGRTPLVEGWYVLVS